jgi:hypothetical protein
MKRMVEVKVFYRIKIEANSQSDAIQQAMYLAPCNGGVYNLSMVAVRSGEQLPADDPQPVVAAAPHQHTDLTVNDDAPVAGQTTRWVEAFAMDTKSESTEQRVGNIGSKP